MGSELEKVNEKYVSPNLFSEVAKIRWRTACQGIYPTRPSHSVGNNRRVEDRWWYGGARRHLFKRRCRVDENDAYDCGTRTRREEGGKANPDFQRAQKYLTLLPAFR